MSLFKTTSIGTIALGLLLFGSYAPIAEAHTLAVSGDMGAVLHTDPNDEPVAESPATLYFEFKNSKAQFDSSAYATTLSITSTDTSTSSPLTITGSSANMPYVFEKPGIYTATVTGISVATKVAAFTLTYQIRVTPATASAKGPIATFFGVHGAHALLTGILVLILLYVIISEKRKERRARAAASPPHQSSN